MKKLFEGLIKVLREFLVYDECVESFISEHKAYRRKISQILALMNMKKS